MRLLGNRFQIILQDGTEPFQVPECDLLCCQFKINAPETRVSAERKEELRRKTMRESKRREEEIVKQTKIGAKALRENWLQNQFNKMKQKIKDENYTSNEFKELLHHVQQPYKHVSSDIYEATVNDNEIVCVSKLAVDAIDGVLITTNRVQNTFLLF